MQQKIINSYELQQEIGRGGMAAVYLAHDKKFDANIAIKILNKEFVHNENIRKRFLAEARNMFKMSHPNIIKVTDLIDEGDTVAFVMEYVEGETLKEYIERKGKLNDEEIKSMFSQILDAVGYVHNQNLVHRDIKPSNFMLDKRNSIKLMDFGIAKNTDISNSDYTQTGTGVQMGTPMYMSPEQITETKSVTAQSDIYSLGVVLWQMVSGQKPYESQTLSSFQLMTKIVNDTLPKTSTIWDDLIQKATRKEINDRFSSCHDFYSSIQMPTNNKFDVADDKTILISSSNAEKTVIENVIKQEILLKASVLASDGVLKYGFINRQGNWVIQPMFDSLYSFDDQNFAQAKHNERYGFINRQGNWVIQPFFDCTGFFDNHGYAYAQFNEKYGFINRQGNWLIQPVFGSTGSFDSHGYAYAELNEKYGFINRQGNWVIQPIFDSLSSFDEQGIALVKLNEKYGFINRQNNWVIQPIFNRLYNFDDNGLAQAKLDEKYGFINRQGDWVIQPMFDSLDSFDDQDFAQAERNEKYGFINRQSKWVIQPMFDYIGSFDNHGYAYAKLNEKYGFINRQGNWVIQPMYDNLFNFDESGYANASLNQKWGVVNRQGNWVIQPMFDSLNSFDNQGLAISKLNDKQGCINRQGNWVIQPTHLCESIEVGIFKVSLDNKYGFMNSRGEWLVSPIFDYILETDTFFGEAMKWNEATKEWDYVPESEEDGNFDEEKLLELIESMSNSIKAKNLKSYFGKEIPDKKLYNFWKRFQNSTLPDSSFYWYFDNTLFGKGDDGMAIIKTKENRWFLLVAEFAGEADFFELVQFDKRFKDFDGIKRLSDISILDKGMKMVVFYYQNDSENHLSLAYTGFNKELILAVSDCWNQLPGNAADYDFSSL